MHTKKRKKEGHNKNKMSASRKSATNYREAEEGEFFHL
jgi:hypothetical protein